MGLLHRISAHAARGGLWLSRLSVTRGACTPPAHAVPRTTTGTICRLSSWVEGTSPTRRRQRQSTKRPKQVSSWDDGDGGSTESGLQGDSGQDSPAVAKPAPTKRKQEPKASRKGPLSQLTYADGRQVETTFEDGRSIFSIENDEVQSVPERKPAVLADEVLDDRKLNDMEDVDTDKPWGKLRKFGKDESAAAKRYALSLLAAAPQSAANLKRKMSAKKISAEVIDVTIKDLQKCGLQSDREFAELFARSRWRSLSWGPARIKLELRGRGLSEENIEMATKKVFETLEFEETPAANNNAQDVDLNNWGMTAQAKERLLKQASRQWEKMGPEVSMDARQRRLAGWLMRRGFKWSVVADVLKYLGGSPKLDEMDMDEE